MKKFFALTCAIALCMSAFSACAEGFTSLSYLSDTDGHWAEKYIDELFDMGIMAGDNGNSRAEENITRGEFCKYVTRLFNVDAESYTAKNYCYTDVLTVTKISLAKKSS